jgi:hypothetical protein
MFTQIDNNELCWSNRDVPRDPEFQHGYTYKYNQHVRKETVRCISSFVVSSLNHCLSWYFLQHMEQPITNYQCPGTEQKNAMFPYGRPCLGCSVL